MELLFGDASKQVWFGGSARPYAFVSPAPGEFALLLVVVDAEVTDDEQWSLSEQFVRAGCRHAVCFGPTSSSWDDSIDMVGVMDEVHGTPSPFVLTSWFDRHPLEDAAQYFARHARFGDWSAKQFVAFVLGDDAALQDEVRANVVRQFV